MNALATPPYDANDINDDSQPPAPSPTSPPTLSADMPLHTVLASTSAVLHQPPPPTLRDILAAYKNRGDGDRDMLLAMLNAKSAEDQRQASLASLHRTLLEIHHRTQTRLLQSELGPDDLSMDPLTLPSPAQAPIQTAPAPGAAASPPFAHHPPLPPPPQQPQYRTHAAPPQQASSYLPQRSPSGTAFTAQRHHHDQRQRAILPAGPSRSRNLQPQPQASAHPSPHNKRKRAHLSPEPSRAYTRPPLSNGSEGGRRSGPDEPPSPTASPHSVSLEHDRRPAACPSAMAIGSLLSAHSSTSRHSLSQSRSSGSGSSHSVGSASQNDKTQSRARVRGLADATLHYHGHDEFKVEHKEVDERRRSHEYDYDYDERDRDGDDRRSESDEEANDPDCELERTEVVPEGAGAGSGTNWPHRAAAPSARPKHAPPTTNARVGSSSSRSRGHVL